MALAPACRRASSEAAGDVKGGGRFKAPQSGEPWTWPP